MNSRHSIRLIAAVAAIAAVQARPAAAYDTSGWTQPEAPFRIVGGIYYVGSRGLAAYLITSPQGHILLDGTLAENAPMIEANIKALGFRLTDVKILLNSHAHHDHAGALGRLKKDTGAELLASPGDIWALEHGHSRGDNTAGLPPWPAVKVDGPLKDGEAVRLGPIALTAVFTPGHTPGCTSWTTTVTERGVTHQVIFPCSLTVAGNVLVNNKAYPGIVQDYRRSFERLRKFGGADVVLTAHPEFADVLGRHEAQRLGDPSPWADAGQLGALLDDAGAQFDQAVGKPPTRDFPAVTPANEIGWRNLTRTDERFALQFPAPPRVDQGRYDLAGAGPVAARTYTAEQGRVVYRLTVADLPRRPLDREAVFRKAIARLSRGGRLRTYAEARIRTVYGRQISVARPGGGRAVAAVFLGAGRLYELEATAPGPDGRAATVSLVRFQQTLNLY